MYYVEGEKSEARKAEHELRLSNEDASEANIWDPSSKAHSREWKSEVRKAELRLSEF